MTARGIASALGNARRAGQWWRCVCPVHGSRTGHSLSLALRDHPRGLAVHCHAGCSRDDVIAELRRRGLIAGRRDGARLAPTPIGRDHGDNTAQRIAWVWRIWNRARDARATPAERYLARRGIVMPMPASLRWEPRCWHPDTRADLPAMIGAVLDVEGRLVAVHRTYLARDDRGRWHRRDRASLGPVGGGAVRLAPAAETLMVGEGVETCLAAMQATEQPVWAALSTSGMTALVLPWIVRTVVILADHDHNGAGERAARNAAQRWLAEGRQVRIATPLDPGNDMADVLAGRAYEGLTEPSGNAA